MGFLDKKGKVAFSANESISSIDKGSQIIDNATNAVDQISKILNGENSIKNAANENSSNKNVSLSSLMHEQQKKLIVGHGNKAWQCIFDKNELLRIWKVTSTSKLQTEDEKYAYKLMMKYNGSYAAYSELVEKSEMRRKNMTKLGSHVKWDANGLIAENDIDLRAREVLLELDKAYANKNFWMDSQVLHTNDQRFPTEILRLHLEDELDAILVDQVKEREKVDRMNLRRKVDDSESSSDSDNGNDSDDFDEDDNTKFTAAKVAKRAARRKKRQMRLKQDDLKQEVMKARKAVLAIKSSTNESLETALLRAELGEGACLACRTKVCEWSPTVDEEACKSRLIEVNQELDRVRSDPDVPTFTSVIALSSQLGGGIVYEREDLINELTVEKREIERRVHLNLIDKELHDAYNSRAEYIEIKNLHGYSTVMWVNNARKALTARQLRLVAMNVASEVIDDILNHMLEGWYFGERESQFSLAGYVPSVKKDGFMKSGQEQIQAISVALEKAKKRVDDKKRGVSSFERMRGDWEEKLLSIEKGSQDRIEDKRIAKEGTVHFHVLNETEQTLKFGLFMLTFMYFRAMSFVSREKRSWSGADDALQETDKRSISMTDERRRMLDEEGKIKERQKKLDAIMARAKAGEARRLEREAQERKEAVQALQAIVRRQAKEKNSILLLQRIYRGHLGRKAAKRWAMKRAELVAINALLNAAAVCVQRIWRGYQGRILAIETRAEMAYFIALMRVQEAEMDEQEYWQTHALQRRKRDARNFVNEHFRRDYAVKMLGAPKDGDNFDENFDA